MWLKQEERNPRNQDFKATPARMISSGHTESGPGALPGFVFWRADANSAVLQSPPKILTGVAVDVFQRPNTSFDTSRVDLLPAPSYFPFLRNCVAMALAGMEQ